MIHTHTHTYIYICMCVCVCLRSSGSRIWSRGANWPGGPTLKREGCTPDFIESYSLLGAEQRKMYALTLGLGLRAPRPRIRYWYM